MRKKVYTVLCLLFLLSSCGGAKTNKKALAVTYIRQSAVELETKNYKKALQLVNEAVKTNAQPHYFARQAAMLYHVGKFDESFALCQELIEKNDTPETVRAEVRNNLACVYIATGKPEQAEEIWKSLINDRNYLVCETLFYNLGLLALQKKNYQDSLTYLTQAVDMAPDYVDALYYTAVIHKKMGNFGKARKSISKLFNYISHHPAATKLLREVS